jgi:hypothetical protein
MWHKICQGIRTTIQLVFLVKEASTSCSKHCFSNKKLHVPSSGKLLVSATGRRPSKNISTLSAIHFRDVWLSTSAGFERSSVKRTTQQVEDVYRRANG